jgi:hypothetical protein
VQPKDVWDQIMVADITNHFWEQQRYRRCTGAIVNSKRRTALLTILRDGIGLNPTDAGKVADIYFDVGRYEENALYSYLDKLLQQNPAQVPKTKPAVLAFLKEHGFAKRLLRSNLTWRACSRQLSSTSRVSAMNEQSSLSF